MMIGVSSAGFAERGIRGMADEKWTKMDISPTLISIGKQRIPVRSVASVSIRKAQDKKEPEWGNTIGGIFVSVIVAVFVASDPGSNPPLGLGIFVVGTLISLAQVKPGKKELNELTLLTSGGSITVLQDLETPFAEKVLAALEFVISGQDRHTIHIDASRQQIQFGDVKTYTAGHGGVAGENITNVSTNVQGVQDVDALIARMGDVVRGEDRKEILALLHEIRDYLKDGSVSKDKAKSAYNDLFSRIGKYASGANDIINLAVTIGKFFL